MTNNTVALIACLVFLSSEISYRKENPNISRVLGIVSVILFLFAGSKWYTILASLIALLGVATHLLLCKTWKHASKFSPFQVRFLVGFLHNTGLFAGPLLVYYGYTGSFENEAFFMKRELAHLCPSFAMVLGFVVYPLFVHSGDYFKEFTLSHQRLDSLYEMVFGFIAFTGLTTVRIFAGYEEKYSSFDLEHESFGLVYAASGFLSWLLAKKGKSTDLGMVLPLFYMSYVFGNHNHFKLMLPEEEYVAKSHKLCGWIFGLAALCRLGKRRVESLTFAYLANSFFFLSSLEPSLFWTTFFENNFELQSHADNNEGHNHELESMHNMRMGDEAFRAFSPVIIVMNIFFLALQYIVLTHLRTTVDPEYDPTLKRRKELENQFEQLSSLDLKYIDGDGDGADVEEAVALT